MSASSALKGKPVNPNLKDEALRVVTAKPNLKSIYFNNSGLFAENYLVNRLPNERSDSFVMQHWETEDLPEFNACYEWMLSTWAEYKDILPGLSEAQLEDKWIRPILERLGWTYEVQDRLKRRGKTQIPDYSLFDSVDTYKKAKGCTNNEKYFSYVLAVADAKTMGIDLDGKGNSNSNPSYQIVRYMEDTDTRWGILTDGEYWRLYSTHSKSRHTTFYEVNIRKALAGRGSSPRDDFAFKYFFNFFRKASLADRDAAGKSFLDIVFESGERYAREVETQLKDRAFRIVESIAKGFSGNKVGLTEEELRVVYQHSLYYLFRLLFVLNCESRGILNVNDSANYFPHSLRAIAHRLKEEFERNVSWASRPKVYDDLSGLFDLLETGDKTIDVFPFGKDLFATGKRDFFEKRKIPDAELNKAILELACAYGESGDLQFIDYGRLGADHIGSIFEGLLEYSLKYADRDFVVDKRGNVSESKAVDKKPNLVQERISKGSLYLSTGSGERRASGAFYTPDNIVDYIVEDTLKPLCEGKSAEELLDLKICDPAMGSGHFLIGTIRFLEKRVLDKLFESDDKAADIDAGEIRWKILHNCVRGVDINPIAVELAKFSLWIFTVRPGYQLEPLSDLLVCGDSLLDTDLPHRLFQSKEMQSLFDAIVGNPPYVYSRSLGDYKQRLESASYLCAEYQPDLYIYFLERAISWVRKGGIVGMITPNSFLHYKTMTKLRKFLISEHTLKKVTKAYGTFKEATVDTVILSLFNESPKKGTGIQIFEYVKDSARKIRDQKIAELDSSLSLNLGESKMNLNQVAIFTENHTKLGELFNVTMGIKIRPEFVSEKKGSKDWVPFLKGRDVFSFYIDWSNLYVLYTKEAEQKYPNQALRKPENFLVPKILLRQTADNLIASFDADGYYAMQSTYSITPKAGVKVNLKYVAAILNSRLMRNFYSTKFKKDKSVFPQIRAYDVKELPIKVGTDKQIDSVVKIYDRLAKLRTEAIETHPIYEELNVLIEGIYGIATKKIAS